jgi:hypothetical protein
VTLLLQRAEAGLIDIKVALQVLRSLPLIIIPQQDVVLNDTVSVTVLPAASGTVPAPAPIQLIPDVSTTYAVPFVVVAPPGLTAPMQVLIPPQQGSLGLPLLVFPQETKPPVNGDAGLKAVQPAETSLSPAVWLGAACIAFGLAGLVVFGWRARASSIRRR